MDKPDCMTFLSCKPQVSDGVYTLWSPFAPYRIVTACNTQSLGVIWRGRESRPLKRPDH